MVMEIQRNAVTDKAKTDRFANMFCSFGEKSKKIDQLKGSKSYKKMINELEKDMNAARKELASLQNGRLDFMADLGGRGRHVVSREELDEARLRYALAKKLVDKATIESGNSQMLID